MKMFIAAVALTIAVPALAQTADPHAGHEKMACCEKMKDGGKMDCCEKGKDGKAKACCDKQAKQDGAKADPHAGHDMSKK